MKRLAAILILLLLPCSAYATAYTASGSGSFNSDATWGGGGHPVAGDTANLNGKNITVDSDAVVGLDTHTIDVTGGGTLTINTGCTFTLKGRMLATCNITMQAGSAIVLYSNSSQSADIRLTGGTLTCNGTSGSHCTISSSTANSSNGYFSVSGAGQNGLVATYTDFVDVGTNVNRIDLGTNIQLTHCTFTRCGAIGVLNTQAAGDFDLQDVTHTSYSSGVTGSVVITNLSAPTGGHIRNISNCAFDNKVIFGGDVTNLTIEDVTITSAKPTPLTIGTANTSSGAFTSINNVLAVQPASATNTGINLFAPGPVTRSIVVNNYTEHCARATTHNAGTYQFSNNVFIPTLDSDGADGIVIYNTATSLPASMAVTITNNICLPTPNGDNSCTLFNHASRSKNLTITCDHNTTAGNSALSQGGGDNVSCIGTGILSSFRSNLYFTTVAGQKYALMTYSCDRHTRTGTTTYRGAFDKGTFTAATDATHGVDSTASPNWGTVFDNNADFGFLVLTGSAAGKYTKITGNASGTSATVAAWKDSVTPASGDGYIIVTRDPFSVSNVDYNCMYNALATGRIDYLDGTSQTSVQGYNGYYLTAGSGVPGSHDKWNTNPNFVDATRTFATYDSAATGLNNSATAWSASSVPYVVGDIVSRASSGVYGNTTVNYRCIANHTSGTSTDNPGTGTNWRTKWEYAAAYRMRLDRTLIDSCVTWIQNGYRPTNATLRNAGHDGVTIGAVEGSFAKPTIWYYLNARNALERAILAQASPTLSVLTER